MTSETRVALISGGAKGIGRAMALGLLASGVKVAVAARDRSALDALAREATATFPAASIMTLEKDLASPAACHTTVLEVIGRFGHLDILVNNAGIGTFAIRKDALSRPVSFWEVDLAQWHQFLDINVTSAFLLAKAATPHMIERGFGRIINVTTSLGSMLGRGLSAYGASKAALEALTAVMAADLVGTGVTANVITPGGYTDTAMIPDETGIDRSTMLRPEIMVGPLLWIISDAAGQTTRRRFVATTWDASKTPAEAAEMAGSPVAWLPLVNPS